MHYRFFLLCTLLLFLAACAPASAASSPLPTLPQVEPTALLPVPAASSPAPEILSPTPETTFPLEPTISPLPPPLPTLDLPSTPPATSMPQPAVGSGAIQFYGPGPLSKLVTKVAVYGYAIPGYGNKGRVYLYGEDGRLLASELLQLNTAYTWAYFYWTLPFEIQGAGELARLTMSTEDEFGRLTAAYSIHLILLADGYSIVNPPGDFRERCVVDQPVPGSRIAGGLLAVTGEMHPFNSLPLVIELIDRDGNVISSQPVAISPAPDDGYVPFQVILPYSISSGTWALLVVHQPDDRISGTIYLYSREVFLDP